MNASLPIFRVRGVEVRIHWTWVILLAMITVGIAEGLTVEQEAGSNVVLAWVVGAISALVILVSVIGHELAHVAAARTDGIGAAPATATVVTVQLLGGTYVMESRPATAAQELRMAGAGPVASLVLTVALTAVGMLLRLVVGDTGTWSVVIVTAAVPASFNFFLALVSLLPAYPMDGARVVHALAWRRTGDQRRATRTATGVGRLAGIAVMLAGAVMVLIVDPWPVGAALILVGWLLIGSSRLLERRLVIEELVAGATVGEAADSEFSRLPPQLTLDVFAADYLRERAGSAAVVERGEEPLGLIGAAQIRRVPPGRWPLVRVEQAMVPIDRVPHASNGGPLWPALEILERSGLDALIVDSEDAVMRLLSRASISRLVRKRAELQVRGEQSVLRLRRIVGGGRSPRKGGDSGGTGEADGERDDADRSGDA